MIKYLLVALTFFFISCDGMQRETSNLTNKDSTRPRLIPYFESSALKSSRQEQFLKNLGKLMELPTLANIKDDLYIRIWLWERDKKYVVNISEYKGQRQCNVIEFNSSKIDTTEYIQIFRELKHLKPQNGWDNFIDSLNKYQIPNLNSGKSFEEQNDYLTEMAYVQFEIARPNEYRFYEYLEPSYYRYVDRGSNNVYQFLKFFVRETGIEVYNPSDKLVAEP